MPPTTSNRQPTSSRPAWSPWASTGSNRAWSSAPRRALCSRRCSAKVLEGLDEAMQALDARDSSAIRHAERLKTEISRLELDARRPPGSTVACRCPRSGRHLPFRDRRDRQPQAHPLLLDPHSACLGTPARLTGQVRCNARHLSWSCVRHNSQLTATGSDDPRGSPHFTHSGVQRVASRRLVPIERLVVWPTDTPARSRASTISLSNRPRNHGSWVRSSIHA